MVIVGAGLSGLCAARTLLDAHQPFLLLDASDAVGGRLRTDAVDTPHGQYRLDRGFQVLQTAYPAAQATLDYDALALRRFDAGALVYRAGRLTPLYDPWRHPLAALRHAAAAFTSGVATPMDALRIARLRRLVSRSGHDALLNVPSARRLSTHAYLQERGFSKRFVDAMLRPWFAGVFLEQDLATSAAFFLFAFRHFTVGDCAVPAAGMQTIPTQLAAPLPQDTLRLHTPVSQAAADHVTLATGERLDAAAVLVATEAPAASRLLGLTPPVASCRTTCLYFDLPRPPTPSRLVAFNASGQGVVNNACVLSNVAPELAPAGRCLLSASLVTQPHGLSADPDAVSAELAAWFGFDPTTATHLHTCTIDHALPAQPPAHLTPPERPARLDSGVFVAGDHRDTASIQGAMRSGQRVAQAVLTQLDAAG